MGRGSSALVAIALGSTATGFGQGLERRVAAAPDGTVRLTFAARPGVCGDGRSLIAFDCEPGSPQSPRHIRASGSWIEGGNLDCHCALGTGPVHVALTVRGGKAQRLCAYVGAQWGGSARTGDTTVTDLGAVSTREATDFLLGLAAREDGKAGDEAIFAATLADSVTVWPALLKLARDERLPHRTRRAAVFWLGQAAGDAAARELTGLVEDGGVDREVKEAAVFALSQRPRDEGVPTLIRIARTHPDPEVRKKAIFWLGQSEDSRALALFEELLTKDR